MAQAALVLLYGIAHGEQKRWPLHRDATIIGKSRGCDLVLEAPDISSLHCVISRHAGGYSLRDCNSRAGIRLNGDAIEEASLHDGDLLQIGPFSFQLALPPASAAVPAAEPRHLRLERKRRNLVRLALWQRRQAQVLAQRLAGRGSEAATAFVPLDVAQQVEALQQRMRDCERRAAQLDQGERELTRDRAILQQEREEFRELLAKREQELEERESWLRQHEDKLCQPVGWSAAAPAYPLAAEEPDLTEEQLQQTCVLPRWSAPAAAAEEDLEKTMCIPQVNAAGPLLSPEEFLAVDVQNLLLRPDELHLYVRSLRHLQQCLQDERQQLELAKQHIHAAGPEVSMPQSNDLLTREEWEQQYAEAIHYLQQQQAALDEQREQLGSLLTESNGTDADAGIRAELEALRQENQQLWQLAREQEAQGREEEAGLVSRAELLSELENLQRDNEMLRQLLETQRSHHAEQEEACQASLSDMPAVEDVDSYEAELVQFRRQLEEDRHKLNQEIHLLRQRQLELEDATRDVEMELSRERATLARERMQLERMREEIQNDLQRLQRDAGIHGRLAPVQQLRQEIVDRRQAGTTPPPPTRKDNPLLQNLRNNKGK